MINCVIIDDEPLARNILEQYIHSHQQMNLLKICSNAKDAYGVIQELQPDLVFLDIQMPGINGIELVNSLKNPPPIIFTTAYTEFASTSYELEAVDYLVKPITVERFTKSINKFLKMSQAESEITVKNYLYIKSGGDLVKVKFSEIIYVQSMKDYVKVFTTHGQLITLLTLKSLLEMVPSAQFIQTHRSFIVNSHYISAIKKGTLIVQGYSIPIGEKYKDKIVMI